jgi:hypothetical protein
VAKKEKASVAGTERAAQRRERLTTAFGWVAGGAAGLLVNYVIFRIVGAGYPTTITTFAFFLLGAFGGMALSDRLGPRAFTPLGIAAGVLLALFVSLFLTGLMAAPAP